jgi:hypothetical protein
MLEGRAIRMSKFHLRTHYKRETPSPLDRNLTHIPSYVTNKFVVRQNVVRDPTWDRDLDKGGCWVLKNYLKYNFIQP